MAAIVHKINQPRLFMQAKARFLIFLIFCLAAALPSLGYQIDLDGPIHLLEQPPTVSIPTSVSIFVCKPKVNFDKAISENLLRTNSPTYSTTNMLEIRNLISILQQQDNEERITNESRHLGRTWHVLLFQEKNKTVMQFRVFEPLDIHTVWCDIYPRTTTGFGFSNKDIRGWLHSRLTNSITLTQ